jgi:hypothetical protein
LKDLFSILIIIQTRVRLLPTTLKYVFLFLALYGTTGYNKSIAQKLLNSSDNYFDSRPESKLGAVVSNQSEVLLSRLFRGKFTAIGEKTLVVWLFQDPNIGELLSCT